MIVVPALELLASLALPSASVLFRLVWRLGARVVGFAAFVCVETAGRETCGFSGDKVEGFNGD